MNEETNADTMVPIIIDLGKQSGKRIKALKRGRGRLMDEVGNAVDLARENLGEEVKDKILVPIVVIYRKKQKSMRRSLLPC